MRPCQKRFFAFLYLAVGFICGKRQTAALQTLHVLGLFPFQGIEERELSMKGELVQPAVSMAIEDINRLGVLPGYRLKLHSNDTKCRADYASRVFFEMINKEPTKAVIIGPGCSSVSERIAEEAKAWHLAMVSYGSTSPTLSDRARYPYFFRTIPSDLACNQARIALLKKFNWKQVGLLVQSDVAHSTTIIHLQEDLQKEGIHILASETFGEDPTQQVNTLKEKDVRIIIGDFDEQSARQVFCQAYRSGLYGARYVWLIPGWYDGIWWTKHFIGEKPTCSQAEMYEAVKGCIACDNLKMSPDDSVITISGLTVGEFRRQYHKRTGQLPSLTDAGFAYDATWMIALALNRTQKTLIKLNPPLSLENVSYFNSNFARCFKSALEETAFAGVTGPVSLSPEGDRMGYLKIQQLQDGKKTSVALYFAQNHSIVDVEESTFIWRGNGPPPDHSKLVTKLMTISPALFGTICVITVFCIILAACFLAFNIKLRHYRYIKMSSPRLNDTIVIGCMTMYASVILFGLDSNLVSTSQYSALCQARIWIASLGFTTSFSAMFAKIWRVYVIFTNAKLRKKVIQDNRLFLFVGLLLLVDVVTLGLWTGIDSLSRRLQNGTIEQGTQFDVLRQWEYCDCRHKSIWFGVLFATKGLLLLFGVFLAWETRHVKIPALNDSRFVGMSVYNVVILSVIGVPATLLIEQAQNTTFAITAVFVIFCTTVTLCLVFVPKFIAVKRNPNVLNTSGATSTSASQASGESSTSQDKGIGGPKFIALAAENSNLKALVAEKEEQITQLEAHLKRQGVPLENLRQISMVAKHIGTTSCPSPNLHASWSDRNSAGSIRIEVPNDKGVSSPEVKSPSDEKEQERSSGVKQRYSPFSSSKLDSGSLLGHDLSKAAIPKQHSLPPRARENVPQIEVRNRTHSEVFEAYENPVASIETREVPNKPTRKKKMSLPDHLESPSYVDSKRNHSGLPQQLPSPRARYSRHKKESHPHTQDNPSDVNDNSLPPVKDVQAKQSRRNIHFSKSKSGETCFQVKKTPAEFREEKGLEEINI